ncbi:hypothetical protein E1264_23330 [Actinomadura sp. KC216]|nr:hypothetical protein E1264_23330 [Actinomadura sp. KC216]
MKGLLPGSPPRFRRGPEGLWRRPSSQQAMTSLRQGRTAFVIAHRPSTIRDADRFRAGRASGRAPALGWRPIVSAGRLPGWLWAMHGQGFWLRRER